MGDLERRLLREVIADPEADAPRLELASMLATRGDPRGELISLQIKIFGYQQSDARVPQKLRDREKELLDRHAEIWAEPLAARVDRFVFRRGFVEQIRLDAHRFLDEAEDLFDKAPIRHLSLTGVAPAAGALFASKHLRRMVSLGLTKNGLEDYTLELLAASPNLERLRWLGLAYNKITIAGLEALASSDRLPSLKFVHLVGNDVEDPTPQLGGKSWDAGAKVEAKQPALGRALIKKFGARAWLEHAPSDPERWPPDRDEV